MNSKTQFSTQYTAKILKLSLFFVTLFLGASVGFAQTTWNFGGTPDKSWSNVNNWSTGASPAGTDVVFGSTGMTSGSTSVGNIVDQNFTINTLSFKNSSTTSWQVAQIATGQTLAVSGAFALGGLAVTATTQVAILGPGAFTVDSSGTGNFTVNNAGFTTTRATLDLSGLSTFTANVAGFNIGTGATGFGTVLLANNSTITATSLTSGGSGSTYSATVISNILKLGAITTLNVDAITLGRGRTIGNTSFQAGLTGATLKIRAKDGMSRVNTMSVGDLAETGAATNTATTTVDLTGGSVDALVGALTVGNSPGSLSTSYGASLSMASGTFDATSVVVGQTMTTTGTNTGTLTGNLNVSGGTFIAGSMTLANNLNSAKAATKGNLNVSGSGAVTVSGTLTLGVRTGAVVTPTVNITGGTLTIGGGLAGKITEGSGAGTNITSSVNLSGGVLDMSRGSIAVDNFNFTGGTLKNVTSFVVGTGTVGALKLQNAATLAYDLNGSTTPLALTGTLDLGGSPTANLSLALANDFSPVTITLVDNDGVEAINGTFATFNGGAFGPGNTFTLTNNLGSFDFSLSYTGGDGNDLVALAVPEPGTWAMLFGGFGMLNFWQRIRRRKV